MKKMRVITILAGIALCAGLLAGCGCSYTGASDASEAQTESVTGNENSQNPSGTNAAGSEVADDAEDLDENNEVESMEVEEETEIEIGSGEATQGM